MSFIETNESAVAEQTEVGTESQFSGANVVDVLEGTMASEATDFLDTPAGKLPPKQPEIHQGTVTGITTDATKSGTVGINVHLQSKDTGASDRYTIWAPQEFFNPEFWSGGKFNYDGLASVPAPGKKQSPRQRYATTINSDSATIAKDGSYVNFADIQLLRTIAKEQGQALTGATAPADGVAFIELLNQLVTGISVVYTRRPEKNDNPEYDGQLKVNRIIHPSVLQLASFDTKFGPLSFDEKTGRYKGYRRSWEFNQ